MIDTDSVLLTPINNAYASVVHAAHAGVVTASWSTGSFGNGPANWLMWMGGLYGNGFLPPGQPPPESKLASGEDRLVLLLPGRWLHPCQFQ